MLPTPSFLFTTCQIGAEAALKSEMARRDAGFHLAFSRPGFVTFKLPEDRRWRDELPRQAVFARTQGFSLGKVTGDDDAARATAFWQLAGAGLGIDCTSGNAIRPRPAFMAFSRRSLRWRSRSNERCLPRWQTSRSRR